MIGYPTQTTEQLAEVQAVTDEAVLQSFENAKDPWKAYALRCVSVIAKKMETFTVNDVRPLVAQSPFKTQDNRALGGVIKQAEKKGWIYPTGETRVNKTGHGTAMQVWGSNIHGETIEFVVPEVPEPPKVDPYADKCPHGLPKFVACPNCQHNK